MRQETTSFLPRLTEVNPASQVEYFMSGDKFAIARDQGIDAYPFLQLFADQSLPRLKGIIGAIEYRISEEGDILTIRRAEINRSHRRHGHYGRLLQLITQSHTGIYAITSELHYLNLEIMEQTGDLRNTPAYRARIYAGFPHIQIGPHNSIFAHR